MARATFIQGTTLPPSNSMTLGEMESRLVFITQNESEEKRIVDRFTAQKGIIFKSISIPSKHFERYSSRQSVDCDTNKVHQTVQFGVRSLSVCVSYLTLAWTVTSPSRWLREYSGLGSALVQRILKQGASRIPCYLPSIGQQTTSSYYSESALALRQRDIAADGQFLKFAFHPLYRKLAIAFKHGVVFFDLKRNQWLSNSLSNEHQCDITDFSFSHSGHLLCVVCAKGVFVWSLRPNNGGFTFSGELVSNDGVCAWDSVRFSPNDEFMAVWRRGSRTVHILDAVSFEVVYRHQIWYALSDVRWVPSSKQNKHCPLRLLLVTDSRYLLLLSMLTFATESFECRSDVRAREVCVSKTGDGLLVSAQNAQNELFHISMRPFCEPRKLADLSVKFDAHRMGDTDSDSDNDGDGDVVEEDDDAKAGELDGVGDAVLRDRVARNGKGNGNGNVTYSVKHIRWSPCDRRIAVLYDACDAVTGAKRTAKFVALWAYDFDTSYRLGFITHPHGGYPLDAQFRNNFRFGAQMAISWSNGVISQHHLSFNANLRTR